MYRPLRDYFAPNTFHPDNRSHEVDILACLLQIFPNRLRRWLVSRAGPVTSVAMLDITRVIGGLFIGVCL